MNFASQAYLLLRLGIDALDGARHNEAADHFTAAVNASALASKSTIRYMYEDLVVVREHDATGKCCSSSTFHVQHFGWGLKSLWQTAKKNRCRALIGAGRLEEAVESYRYMMDMSDEVTKISYLEWSAGKSSVISFRLQSSPAFHSAFVQECSTLYAANGDAALATNDYDKAIDSYSAAIDLDPASDTISARRSKAKSENMLWEEVLLDAQKVRPIYCFAGECSLYGDA